MEQLDRSSKVQSVSQPLLCLPIVTICVKETAGQEEGKDKFQRAGMYPESRCFRKYLQLLFRALLLVLIFLSAVLYGIWLPGEGGSL